MTAQKVVELLLSEKFVNFPVETPERPTVKPGTRPERPETYPERDPGTPSRRTKPWQRPPHIRPGTEPRPKACFTEPVENHNESMSAQSWVESADNIDCDVENDKPAKKKNLPPWLKKKGNRSA